MQQLLGQLAVAMLHFTREEETNELLQFSDWVETSRGLLFCVRVLDTFRHGSCPEQLYMYSYPVGVDSGFAKFIFCTGGKFSVLLSR